LFVFFYIIIFLLLLLFFLLFFYKVISKCFEERSKVFQNDYTLFLSHQPMRYHTAITTKQLGEDKGGDVIIKLLHKN